jgi:hypothetical protein
MAPISVGDYGSLNGRLWTRLGSIRDPQFAIQFTTTPGTQTVSREYKSENTSRALFAAGAGVATPAGVSANAKLELEFHDDFSVYMNLISCTIEEMDRQAEIGEELIRRSKLSSSAPGYWNHGKFRMVTSVVRSNNTTIVVASKKGARMTLEASAQVPTGQIIDLKDPQLKLNVSSDVNVSESWITERGTQGFLTPLFTLGYVDRGWFGAGGGEFKPATANALKKAKSGQAPQYHFVGPSVDLTDWRTR